ncbi:MAG: phosphoglucomutase [Parafannyhessea sp.]|uniref:phosphoglucomutase n=1 Tax=Parafannyhessea sp. TaxID=2847324 RepID=UPI003F0D47D0
MRNIHFRVGGWYSRRDEGYDLEGVRAVAAALGVVWGTVHEGATIVVGYDTRHDSEDMALEAAGLIASCGLRVLLANAPTPAPVLEAGVARDDACVGGVLVSGGDYSSDYGGVLVCGPDGGSVSDAFAHDVDKLISSVPGTARGRYARVDLQSPYVLELMGLIDAEAVRSSRPRVVVDSMYGTAQCVVPSLLRDLGVDVVELHAGCRADFGGLHPRAIEPWVDDCEAAVVREGADLGLAFGGDCRRLALVDARGRMVSVHDLGPLVLDHLVGEKNGCGRVVGTLACSERLERQAERLGLDYTAVPVGFSRLHAEMADGDVLMAAEEYGGLAFPNHLAERDAILAALYILEELATRHATVEGLVQGVRGEVGRMAYGREDITLDVAKVQAFRNILPGLNPRAMAGKTPVAVNHAGGLKVTFDDGSWAMLRPSRSQSIVRAYAEAATREERDDLLKSAEKIVYDGLSGDAAG